MEFSKGSDSELTEKPPSILALRAAIAQQKPPKPATAITRNQAKKFDIQSKASSNICHKVFHTMTYANDRFMVRYFLNLTKSTVSEYTSLNYNLERL
jgi:hypothetical protein